MDAALDLTGDFTEVTRAPLFGTGTGEERALEGLDAVAGRFADADLERPAAGERLRAVEAPAVEARFGVMLRAAEARFSVTLRAFVLFDELNDLANVL